MDITVMCEIENLEREVLFCNGRPKGQELPQVATEQDILNALTPQTYQ